MGAYKIKRIGKDDMQRPVVVNVVDADSLEYHGEWMSDEYVTVNVKDAAPVDFKIDDYVEYRGDIYALGYDPNVVKKSARNTYGEGFTYDTIRLQSLAMKLKGYGFKDYVLDDNGLAYSSLGTFSFFAGSVEDLADRLQANINRQDIGIKTNLMQMYSFKVVTPNWSRCYQRGIDETEWEMFFDDPSTYGTWGSGSGVTLGETDVNIDIDDTSSWEALKLSYTKFGLTWYTKVSGIIVYIVIGGAPIVADKDEDVHMVFRYGKNLGLYEIERTSPDDQELVTRMFAYGSEKNIPLNYYANLYNSYKAKVVSVVSEEWQQYVLDIPNSSNYFINRVASYNAFHVNVSSYNPDPHWQQQLPAVIAEEIDGEAAPTGQCYLVLDDYSSVNRPLLVGEYVYFNAGIDKNNWPSDSEHTDHIEGYPSLLSVNRLMLPGFPLMSLKEWVCGKAAVDDSSIIEGIGPNTIEEVPDLPNTEPNYLEKNKWRKMLRMYAFSVDQYDPWVMSGNAKYAGVIEGTANFDGSRQTEIYPTIEGATDSQGNRLDEVSWAQQMDDNGYLEDTNAYFEMVPGGDANAINWNDSNGNDVVVSMKDGACVGREFKVKTAVKNSDTGLWNLTLERVPDQTTGRYYPYKEASSQAYLFQVMGSGNYQGQHDGDHFVITGINMQPSIIEAASERLLIAACGWLDRRDHVRYTYLPKVDNIYMARQDEAVKEEREESVYGTISLHDTLRAGMRMGFEDAADLGIERYGSAAPFIDVLTIREDGGDGIPSYDVVLRDEKERGALEKMAERIEELTGATNIVERTTRAVVAVDYPEWVLGTMYYHEAMNVEMDRLEQSYVWHRGKKWMCMRTGTTEEPQLGSEDWVVVEGDQTFQIKFYDAQNNGYAYGESVLVRRGHINVPLWPFVLWGTEDVTAKVSTWSWNRTVSDVTISYGTTRNITVTDQSLPDTWSATNPAIFTCTATIVGVDTQITNILTV